ncbi:hypothetical protein [Oscillatoria acuminata]|uniref:hypothetical protein n=1 Tax=Oscillatoria acuminata TaxID=118323 RepID=UPI0002F945D3|nr:hypothetical protein [Oscillatoria acuminata]
MPNPDKDGISILPCCLIQIRRSRITGLHPPIPSPVLSSRCCSPPHKYTLPSLSVYSPRGGFSDDSELLSLSIQTANLSNCRDRYLTDIDRLQ